MTEPMPINQQTVPALSATPGQIIADELSSSSLPKGFDVEAAAKLIAVTDIFTGDVGSAAIRKVRKLGRSTIDVADIDAAVDEIRSRNYRSDLRSWLSNLSSLLVGVGATYLVTGFTVSGVPPVTMWISGVVTLIAFVSFLCCFPRKSK